MASRGSSVDSQRMSYCTTGQYPAKTFGVIVRTEGRPAGYGNQRLMIELPLNSVSRPGVSKTFVIRTDFTICRLVVPLTRVKTFGQVPPAWVSTVEHHVIPRAWGFERNTDSPRNVALSNQVINNGDRPISPTGARI